MKRKQYTIYSDKIDSSKNIAVCSDLHLNENTSKKKISEVLETLDEIKPSHIVIPGDLYDVCHSTIEVKNDIVTDFINEATDIANVYYVKGNIEQRSMLLPYGLYYNNNPHFHLLCENTPSGKDKIIYNNDINVSAIKLPLDFYYLNEDERCKELMERYNKYLEKLSRSCGTKNFNVLLCHDPIIVKALQLYQKDHGALNFDLIISGHNHGGLFPYWMKSVLEFSGVDMERLYPTYTKGIFETNYNQFTLVSEGVTKFHSGFGKLQCLENFHEGTIENVKVLCKKI